MAGAWRGGDTWLGVHGSYVEFEGAKTPVARLYGERVVLEHLDEEKWWAWSKVGVVKSRRGQKVAEGVVNRPLINLRLHLALGSASQ